MEKSNANLHWARIIWFSCINYKFIQEINLKLELMRTFGSNFMLKESFSEIRGNLVLTRILSFLVFIFEKLLKMAVIVVKSSLKENLSVTIVTASILSSIPVMDR